MLRAHTHLDIPTNPIPAICTFHDMNITSPIYGFNALSFRSRSRGEFPDLPFRMNDLISPQMPFECIIWMVLEVLHVARHLFVGFSTRKLGVFDLVSV